MPLPKPKYPKYTTTLPSNGKSVDFRPWTVTDEKLLLTAMEGDDSGEILDAMSQIIEGCTNGEVTRSNIPSFDFEYLFLQTRIKSVAPSVTVLYNNTVCQETCGDDFRLNINLEDVKVVALQDGEEVEYESLPKDYNVIKFNDTDGCTMEYPTVELLKKFKGLSGMDLFNSTIMYSVDTVFDSESVYTQKDFTDEELEEWYGDLTKPDKEKMAKFINNVPRLRYTTEYTCPGCKRHETIVIEGLKSFFG